MDVDAMSGKVSLIDNRKNLSIVLIVPLVEVDQERPLQNNGVITFRRR